MTITRLNSHSPHREDIPRTAVRPRLLVSVKNVAEAQLALNSNVDLLDLKEPTRGSLGMADAATISTVAQLWQSVTERNLPLSAALGEVTEWESQPPLRSLANTPLTFVKLGLSNLSKSGWQQRWLDVRSAWNDLWAENAPKWIAVAYVDALGANAPPVAQVVSAAIETGCSGVLFDTWGKSGGGLFDYIPLEQLSTLVELIRQAGLLSAAAGSLTLNHLPRLRELAVDIIAVRGAVCRQGHRQAELCPTRIRDWHRSLNAWPESLPLCTSSPAEV